MNNNFPRIITLLRKEKKLSQKEAAQGLGVSQALLSHYEKGIRECGLDFVVKASEYYNVSCDYLLGKTTERSFDDSALSEAAVYIHSPAGSVSRRLIASSMDIIYDRLSRIGNRALTRKVTAYMTVSIYRAFRFLYTASARSGQEIFTVPAELYSGYSSAAQEKLFADIEAMGTQGSEGYVEALQSIDLSPEALAKDYPAQAAALFNVIQQAENSLNKIRR